MSAISSSLNFITEAEAAELLGMKPDTLRRWRREYRGPSYHRFGRDIRYATGDIEEFVARNRVEVKAAIEVGNI